MKRAGMSYPFISKSPTLPCVKSSGEIKFNPLTLICACSIFVYKRNYIKLLEIQSCFPVNSKFSISISIAPKQPTAPASEQSRTGIRALHDYFMAIHRSDRA
jgi:hypothetical protein